MNQNQSKKYIFYYVVISTQEIEYEIIEAQDLYL